MPSYRVDHVPNRKSPKAALIRTSWREGEKVRHKTVSNISKLPPDIIASISAVLKGGVVYSDISECVTIKKALPHGHVAAVLETCRNLEIDRILHRKRSRTRDLALAAVVARVIKPGSKLATARSVCSETATSSLGVALGLGKVGGNEMLFMLDWLVSRKNWIEKSLANRNLGNTTLILYDVTSSYLEGQHCPLAEFGYNRDGKKGKKQIVFGLLCAPGGCPIGVEIFSGNTADPKTVEKQIEKIRKRFGISSVALVGDRGMLTTARIRSDVEPLGLHWISALKAVDLKRLVKKGGPPLDVGKLVPDAVLEISTSEFPGERIIVCLNPRLREERRRKREDLLFATEKFLGEISSSVRSGKTVGASRISRRVWRGVNRWKMEKHFRITITHNSLEWRRRRNTIEEESRMDGVYAIRTSLGEKKIKSDEAVSAYKGLSVVEGAFRVIKSHLEVRPVYVYSADHVRGHVFLCMLAYYVEWHMRKRLAPLLFEDDDKEGARAKRKTPVEKAEVSDSAKRKASTKRTPEGYTVHSFSSLLDYLSTITLNEVMLPDNPDGVWNMLSEPTEAQERAFSLLGVDLGKTVYNSVTG